MSLLELQEVSKSYGGGSTDVRAVQDIDLPVNAGALVAVMGPPVDKADGITVRMPSPPVGVGASDGTSRTG
jgi:predicted ABC-type transport system involved in lysophospholipase L1 biosynthesis ATPase subunit